MRKWLDKAWAKAAAFVLTLLLGGLTVLGGIGIGILVSYNVFLDDGAYLRQTLYQEQCYDSLSMANDYLCAQLDSVGLLDKSYYFVNTDAADSAEYNPEAAKQLLSELPRLFADAFSRELSSCQLVVSDPDTGETYLANFDLTESDKRQNDEAVRNGDDRILAAYTHPEHPDWKIWIITEYDRSATTLLFPDEY